MRRWRSEKGKCAQRCCGGKDKVLTIRTPRAQNCAARLLPRMIAASICLPPCAAGLRCTRCRAYDYGSLRIRLPGCEKPAAIKSVRAKCRSAVRPPRRHKKIQKYIAIKAALWYNKSDLIKRRDAGQGHTSRELSGLLNLKSAVCRGGIPF